MVFVVSLALPDTNFQFSSYGDDGLPGGSSIGQRCSKAAPARRRLSWSSGGSAPPGRRCHGVVQPGWSTRCWHGERRNMDIHEIRRDNFLALASEHRNMAELCRLTGVTTAQGSQIKTRKGRMGDAIARRVEQRLGLSSGWMDTPQPRKAGLSDEHRLHELPDRRTRKLAASSAPYWPTWPMRSSRANRHARCSNSSHPRSRTSSPVTWLSASTCARPSPWRLGLLPAAASAPETRSPRARPLGEPGCQ